MRWRRGGGPVGARPASSHASFVRAGVVVAARDDAENMLSGHLCRRRTEPALAIRPVPSQLLEHTLDQDRADVAPIIGAVRYGSPLSPNSAQTS